jgi:hypothetical protein
MSNMNSTQTTSVNPSVVIDPLELEWEGSESYWTAYKKPSPSKLRQPCATPEDRDIASLAALLLGKGGDWVAIRDDDGSSGPILETGVFTPPFGADRWGYKTSQGPQKLRIQTGYVLHGEGWLRHSWFLDPTGRVLEVIDLCDWVAGLTYRMEDIGTDVGRGYFGVILPNELTATVSKRPFAR